MTIKLEDRELSYIAREIKGKMEISIEGIEDIIERDDRLCNTLLESNPEFELMKTQIKYSGEPIKQQSLREDIVSVIQEKTGLIIPYQRLKCESDDLTKGSKVRIRRKSKYYGQNDGVGTMINNFGDSSADEDGYWARVEFDDGYSNNYTIKDLESILDKKTIKRNSEFNDSILREVSQVSFDGFRDYLMNALEKILKKEGENTTPKKGFEIGDLIVMTKKASSVYRLTKEGSEGRIVRNLGDGEYFVLFTKLTGNSRSDQQEFDVNKDCMAHSKTLMEIVNESGGPIEHFKKIVDESINVSVFNKYKDSLKKQNTKNTLGSLIKIGFILPQGDSLVVNEDKLLPFIAPELVKLYRDTNLYSSSDMFSPPSERQPHVLRLELTTGCDYRKCTYCDGYNGVSSNEKSYEEFIEHYNGVIKALGEYKRSIKRLFVGGGNALGANQKTLAKAFSKITKDFNPSRIAIYGRTDAILDKGTQNLKELKSLGLSLIYWGIESGSDDVLRYVNKGTSKKEMLKAAEVANRSGIDLSVMIMPGLGGMKYYDSHVEETALLLNNISAKYITLMAINVSENSKYAKKMQQEINSGNRPLTYTEIIRQTRDMLDLIKPREQKIGMFNCGIDQVGNNPIAFNVEFNRSGKKESIEMCEKYLRT